MDKKSEKGASEWARACMRVKLPVKSIPTPVNTRWASVVNTLAQMLKYRAAVESCFQAQSEHLQARPPSARDWIVLSAIVTIMSPVMDILIHSETRSFYLLSDALVKMVEVHGRLSQQLNSLPDLGTYSTVPSNLFFEDELKCFKRRMLSRMVKYLESVLFFLRSFDSSSAFMFSAIALDPRFKGFSLMKHFAGGAVQTKIISDEYDDKIIIPLLARARGIVVEDVPEAQSSLEDESSGIFDEGASDDGRLDQLRWELNQFRREKDVSGRSTRPSDCKDALKWLRYSVSKYPAISRLSRAVLGIAPTQVDNEIAFSAAGLVCSLRCSRMKVSTLSHVVHILLNTRDKGIFEDFSSTDAKFCDELEVIGQSSVVDNDLNADLREEDDPIDSDGE